MRALIRCRESRAPTTLHRPSGLTDNAHKLMTSAQKPHSVSCLAISRPQRPLSADAAAATPLSTLRIMTIWCRTLRLLASFAC